MVSVIYQAGCGRYRLRFSCRSVVQVNIRVHLLPSFWQGYKIEKEVKAVLPPDAKQAKGFLCFRVT